VVKKLTSREPARLEVRRRGPSPHVIAKLANNDTDEVKECKKRRTGKRTPTTKNHTSARKRSQQKYPLRLSRKGGRGLTTPISHEIKKQVKIMRIARKKKTSFRTSPYGTGNIRRYIGK